MPDMATNGCVALVTGAAQGLGLAAARQLLAMGFRGILMLDRNGELLRHAASGLGQGKTLALQGDLMDSDLPCRAVEACLQRFGRLDVLINAAGNTEGVVSTTRRMTLSNVCSVSMPVRRSF
jgi:meso-butanediol dehydrogenase/(S,S)-butanediol dehydrogenase/diacetyl reductase